jgi:hypothetical protein
MTVEPVHAQGPSAIAQPAMRQSWNSLTFLHWRYEAGIVSRLLTRGLELDTFDGSAWVGLVPFGITGLTPPRIPAMPWISHFLETNVRTYVIGPGGRRGVWFFSLDAARLAAVVGARVSFALPYYWARMRLEQNEARVKYWSARRIGAAVGCEVEIEKGDIAAPSELDLFLTARFRLYAQRRGKLLAAEIAHDPWPLREAKVIRWKESLLEAAGLPAPQGEPIALYSDWIDVIVGKPRVGD